MNLLDERNPPMRYPDLPDELVADEQKAFTDFFDCVYDNNRWHMNPEFKSGAWYAWQSRAVIANKRIAELEAHIRAIAEWHEIERAWTVRGKRDASEKLHIERRDFALKALEGSKP